MNSNQSCHWLPECPQLAEKQSVPPQQQQTWQQQQPLPDSTGSIPQSADFTYKDLLGPDIELATTYVETYRTAPTRPREVQDQWVDTWLDEVTLPENLNPLLFNQQHVKSGTRIAGFGL